MTYEVGFLRMVILIKSLFKRGQYLIYHTKISKNCFTFGAYFNLANRYSISMSSSQALIFVLASRNEERSG